jgi:hypothetical protein
MRKDFNGLQGLVRDQLGLKPRSGHSVFVLRSRAHPSGRLRGIPSGKMEPRSEEYPGWIPQYSVQFRWNIMHCEEGCSLLRWLPVCSLFVRRTNFSGPRLSTTRHRR